MFDQSEIVRTYNEKGVVRIPAFLSKEEVRTVRERIDRFIRDELDLCGPQASTREADGKTVRNLWHLEKYCDYFQELADRHEIRNLVAELVNGEPVLVAVETFNKPARIGSGVPYHQDNAYFCLNPPDALTVWVAIDEVTVENGAVYFVEGSQKNGMLPTKKSGVAGNSIGLAEAPAVSKEKQFCATLQPGDATIHHCQTIHHSDPNKTDRSRLGLLFVFRGAHAKQTDRLLSNYKEAVTATPPTQGRD
jgi:ectoine hydroxylase-related dioxygenase (phytanoyl-CoA dioxygenase family)